jgi:hypothetical protein
MYQPRPIHLRQGLARRVGHLLVNGAINFSGQNGHEFVE